MDIVPTTAQELGIELPYRTDGEPISADGTQDGSGTETVAVSSALKRVVSEPFSKLLAERDLVLRRSARQLGARTGLFQVGPRPSLLGRRAPRVSRRSARIDSRLDFRNVSLGGGAKVPAFVNGTLAGGLAGSVIAIGVNRRIVATCRAFRFRGKTRWGAVVPPSSLRQGSNSVGVYRTRGRRLIPLGGS